jgi:predicted alpha/beta superfamily hydrolase
VVEMTGPGGVLRSSFTIEESWIVDPAGLEGSREVRIGLPPSYAAEPERRYPVLWVLDNLLERAIRSVEDLTAAGAMKECIVVAIGFPGEIESDPADPRRSFDLLPGDRPGFGGEDGRVFDAVAARHGGTATRRVGGARHLLAYLVDVLRPEVGRRYRVGEHHTLAGVSAGGVFVGHALFARPGAFDAYLCASPNLNADDHHVFRLEEEYAAQHDDLAVALWLAAGDRELTQPYIRSWGIVSSTCRLVERLSSREYPSLRIGAELLPRADHLDVVHRFLEAGLRWLWRDAPA